jgi:hypothetical protein
MIDGMLHVQMWADKERTEFDQSINLVDSEGNQQDRGAMFAFELDENGEFAPESDMPSFREYVFDIDPDELEHYRLTADFYDNKYLDGNWNVTFNANEDDKKLETDCAIMLEGVVLNHMTVTPFGVSFSANGSYSGPGDRLAFLLSVTVNTAEGAIPMPANAFGYDWESDKFYVNCDAEFPIDMDAIQSVTVNDEVFSFE